MILDAKSLLFSNTILCFMSNSFYFQLICKNKKKENKSVFSTRIISTHNSLYPENC